jgi:hypothetical protein
VVETAGAGGVSDVPGYEVILKGRDPQDAIFIQPRLRVCGGYRPPPRAQMAFGSPRDGTVVGTSCSFEYLYTIRYLFLLWPGLLEPGWETNPEIWGAGPRGRPGKDIHGYGRSPDHDL